MNRYEGEMVTLRARLVAPVIEGHKHMTVTFQESDERSLCRISVPISCMMDSNDTLVAFLRKRITELQVNNSEKHARVIETQGERDKLAEACKEWEIVSARWERIASKAMELAELWKAVAKCKGG